MAAQAYAPTPYPTTYHLLRSPLPLPLGFPADTPHLVGPAIAMGGVNLDRADDLAYNGSPPRTPRSDSLGASTVSSVGASDPNPRRAPTHGI